MSADLKSVGAEAKAEVTKDIPEKHLEALRSVESMVTEALADVGRFHLQEAETRKQHDRSVQLLNTAEESAKHALSQRAQVQQVLISSLDLLDGSWDINLETGKLVKANG